MKIGIITLALHTNYGGLLQAYALQTALERMGHEVCHIQEKRNFRKKPLWKIPLVYVKRILKKMSGQQCIVFQERKFNKERPAIGKYTDKFITRHIKQLQVENFSDISEKDFDALIVGSDQVWRPKYFYDKIECAYLDFTEGWNIKRIAYAASFGTDKWEYSAKQTKRCGKLLNKFNAVSFREDAGVRLCHKKMGIEAQHVIDPTMLLSAEDYIRLFKDSDVRKSNGNLLTYILDEDKKKDILINNIAKENGLVPFRVNSKRTNPSAPLTDRIQPPVEAWLRGFYDAKLVVTDSFHACVFSILFGKPFIVFANKERGMSRFTSLLRKFELEQCLITDVTDKIAIPKIDFNKVSNLLEKERSLAFKFLNKALEA